MAAPRFAVVYAVLFPLVFILLVGIAYFQYSRCKRKTAQRNLENISPQNRNRRQIEVSEHDYAPPMTNDSSDRASYVGSTDTRARAYSKIPVETSSIPDGQRPRTHRNSVGDADTAAIQVASLHPSKKLPRAPQKPDGEAEVQEIPAIVAWNGKLNGFDRRLHEEMYETSKDRRAVKMQD